MAPGYYMTSKVKIPKSKSANYIVGVRYNRHDHEYQLVIKESGEIGDRKWNIGEVAVFAGYLSRNVLEGFTGNSKSSKRVAIDIVRYLVNNRETNISKELKEFLPD